MITVVSIQNPSTNETQIMTRAESGTKGQDPCLTNTNVTDSDCVDLMPNEGPCPDNLNV
jgi:hypothetical protein